MPALRGVQSRSSMRFRLVCKVGGYHCSVNQLHFRVPCSRLPRGSGHYLYFTLQSSPLLVLLLPNVEKDFLAGFELFVVSDFWAGSDRKMVVSCPMLLHGKGGAIAPLVSHISEFPVHGYLGAHDTIYTSSYRAVRYLCCFAPPSRKVFEICSKNSVRCVCAQKEERVNICEVWLLNIHEDPNFLTKVITGDETWVYGYDPETKRQSSQ
ncbi:hypothetical protein LAZ67_8002306 [Cordylochernes scorpioides]|uniref:Uncharacterized protein n=1 Tax=Cordylochernes scorpioides TaxID=51811 RepID=A0ABY6KQU6_9ARAC|nr:hypothetical protein LAZ67_8002306 [Cordylochernes scorpioides]